jgi:hypothetical protein
MCLSSVWSFLVVGRDAIALQIADVGSDSLALHALELDHTRLDHNPAGPISGLVYVPARDGTIIRGIYRGTVTLTSGRFAVIANEQQFTLVRWRNILERFRGREVMGVARGLGVSWQLGLQRGRGLSR